MATGLIAWTCLLLAAGTPDDVYYMNHRGFQIPIRIQPERKNEVAELILYVSRDQGRTWEISNRAKPDQKAFDFTATGDGMLFFSIAVVDRTGRQDPPDIYKAAVNQKIFIKTSKPAVRLASAEFVADEIQVGWEAREELPDWTSLKLEYRSASMPGSTWTPLPIQRGDRGNLRFRPVVSGEVVLRLVMRDLAGNEGTDERAVGNSSLVSNTNQGGMIRTVGNEGSGPPPLPTPAPTPSSSGMENQPIGRSGDSIPAPAPSPSPSMTPSTSPMPTRGSLPPLQIVNKSQVTLGFDVSRVGPSGLGAVEVFMTADEGGTWEKMPADAAVTLPVSPEVRGLAPQSGKVTIKLPRDGQVYGFHLVVKSRAGLGKQGPRPGDPPQVRVEADVTQPEAALFLPQADNSRGDALVLTWKAQDRNLATNPISLEWSENGRDWFFIGEAQLPNTGSYTWAVPPKGVPPKVHLKLTVRDTAGNVAVAQTSEPVLVDLSRPEITAVSVLK